MLYDCNVRGKLDSSMMCLIFSLLRCPRLAETDINTSEQAVRSPTSDQIRKNHLIIFGIKIRSKEGKKSLISYRIDHSRILGVELKLACN